MKRSYLPVLVALGLTMSLAPTFSAASGAADQLEEIRQERTKSRQQEQLNELRQRDQLNDLKRDQQLYQTQQQLDHLKQQKADPNHSQSQQYQHL